MQWDYLLYARRFHAGCAQVVGGVVSRGNVVVTATAAGDGQIMEKGRCAHDFHIRAFGLCDAYPHLRYPQHVVEVVGRVAGRVEPSNFGFVEQRMASCYSVGLGFNCAPNSEPSQVLSPAQLSTGSMSPSVRRVLQSQIRHSPTQYEQRESVP